ncbi:MAG TPA: hypothetical protein VHA80_05750 [Solirubrobacterales bacterium]|nr:hypothetical protein [Solirubrobacterales bacterium]
MRSIAATILSALALLACGASAASADLPPVHDFTLAYKRTGGIAASTQTLVVRPGRFATATTEGASGSGHRAEFRLAVRSVRSLQRSLAQAHLGSIPGPGPGGCADCFLYDLRYQGHHIALEEVDVPPRLRKVLAEIDAIIAAHG